MQRIWKFFPDVAQRVRQKHLDVGLVGHHDWIHAFRVGEIARQIFLDEWGDERGSFVAGIAGESHNADRILQKEMNLGRGLVPVEAVKSLVAYCVGDALNLAEVDEVIGAVLGHDGRNASDNSRILIALMDADRVVNLDVDLFPRSGQYYHDLPVVDYKHWLEDPEANYRNPKSVLRDIAYSLDWTDPASPVCVRTRLGKRMAEDRAQIFRTFFTDLETQLEEEGIRPYPFEQ